VQQANGSFNAPDRLRFQPGIQNNGHPVEQDLSIHAFEYAVGLLTVIIGLAVVDLATSLHKLTRHRSTVTWDPLALLAALYSMLLIITMWFKLWAVRDDPEIRHYFFYITLCVEYLLLFLIAAASLPDDPKEPCDLRSYYDSNRRYIWTLLVLFQLCNVGHALYFYTHGRHGTLIHIALSFVIPTVCSMVLLATRARIVHYVGVVLLLVLLMLDRASDTIDLVPG
jgi:hypothetical protein